MQIVATYTNKKGESLVFKEEGPFFLQNIEGLEAPENVITSEEVYGTDGARVVGIRLSTRKPILEGTLIGADEKELYEFRREMINTIDLKEPGTLTINIYDKTYEVDVWPIQAPAFKLYDASPGKVDQLNLFTIQFEAFDAYLRDVSYYNSLVPLSVMQPQLRFPVVFKQGQKMTFGTYISGNIIDVCNDGDVAVGAIFHMRCVTRVKNPMIYNVTKQTYFGFSGTYEAGTRFELSTVRGNLYVKKIINGIETNAMPERLDGSTFLQVLKGVNYIQTRADDNTVSGFICEMQYTPLVSGV